MSLGFRKGVWERPRLFRARLLVTLPPSPSAPRAPNSQVSAVWSAEPRAQPAGPGRQKCTRMPSACAWDTDGHSPGESGPRSGDLWVTVPHWPSQPLLSPGAPLSFWGGTHFSGGGGNSTEPPKPLSGGPFLTVSSPKEKFPGTTLHPPTGVTVAFFSRWVRKVGGARGSWIPGLGNSVLGGN